MKTEMGFAEPRPLLIGLGLFAAFLLLSAPLQAQIVTEDLLRRVMPNATSFGLKSGEPPVYPAYRQSGNAANPELIGYIFETKDFPPPETPVMQVKVPNGNLAVIFFRLFSSAPETVTHCPS